MGVHLMQRARACGLRGSTLATLIALADRANEKRERDKDCCWPSLVTLADDAGYCVRTVQGCLNALEQAGHITRFYRSGGSTRYWVHPGGKQTPATSAECQELHHSPADFSPAPRNHCGETIRNQKGNQNKSENELIIAPEAPCLPSGETIGATIPDRFDLVSFAAWVDGLGKQD